MIDIVSPATGDVVAQVPRGTREDVGRAVAAARGAQAAFGRRTAFERAKLCHAVADVLQSRREDLARHLALEQGKPLKAEALGEVDVAARMFRMAAEDGVRLEGAVLPSESPDKRIFALRRPRGVYGVITPWNFPYAIPTEYISAALATGNAVVWVPALTTAGCAVRLLQALHDAGVPPGLVNLVTGDGAEVGDETAGHPGIDAVGFTGSPPVGLKVARRAAGKPQLLELGGNAPTIVLEDADPVDAARRAGRGAFWNAGQICDSTERILVHRSLHGPFVDELLRVAAEFRLGHPLEADTTLGPVHLARGLETIERHLEDAVRRGARVLTGGRRAEGFATSHYFPATVVDRVPPAALLNLEETFGPVAPMLTFETDDEAVALADASPTGLVASVFSADLRRALRVGGRLRAGIVNVNEGSAYWEPHTPFGGASGKQSGVGRLGGRHTLLEMTQTKTMVVDVGEPE